MVQEVFDVPGRRQPQVSAVQVVPGTMELPQTLLTDSVEDIPVLQWTQFIDSQVDGLEISVELDEQTGMGVVEDATRLNWKGSGPDAEKQPDARIMSPKTTREKRSLASKGKSG